ncbi:hypothetical protein ACIG0C_02065 [Kitasatospora aureofaciens]|uniref:Uncharacterized protein n=1 Tax=Kitasatospora aureofaciens TaxID=1894 RepID=A0A1E7N259_KITAU|nr:hypothetical protein [Kitasatospora aureofaciens]OEV34543.1 hypothetical protein HS99_0035200 [Kitasatospora aureofaciens]GGU67236.1 hypothetical protein GCM10010502_17930 [Kitasatospora aureofaciens]
MGEREWVRDGRAVAGWGVGYAGFGLGCGLSGTALWSAAWLGWVVAGVGLAAVGAGWAAARGQPGRWLTWVLRVLCGLAVVASWSLLMDVVTLLFGQAVDSVPDAVHKALAAAGALLLAGTARARRPLAERPATGRPAPSPAPAAVQLAAWAGSLAFLPYVVMKLIWAFGGSFAGVSGDEMYASYVHNGSSGLWLALERRGLDGTVLLAAIGVFLLWGLVRPWGQVFPRWTLPLRGRAVPRWLPLTPALIGAVTLVPYGVVGIGYLSLCSSGVIGIRQGEWATPEQALEVAWVGACAFAGYGVALAVATRSYWRRTGGGRASPKVC